MFKRESTKGARAQMTNTSDNFLKMSDFRAVLGWYDDMGVDCSVSEQPINWLETGQTIDQSWITFKPKPISEPRADRQNLSHPPSHSIGESARPINPQTKSHVPSSPPPQTTAPLSLPSLEKAKELASECQSMEDLRNALESFDGCSLKRTAKNLVLYRGAQTARLMIIGEAPGRDEDIVGKPFVGRAGQLLDRMLKAIHLTDEDTHITNIVYWRPPGNRTPTAEEAALCRPFLDRQIQLVNPEVILFLGGAAAKQMYETPTGITKLRGKWKKLPQSPHKMDTIASLHPAYLLRTPIAKRLAWQDLQMVANKLEL